MGEVPLYIIQRGEETCGGDAADDLSRDRGDCAHHRMGCLKSGFIINPDFAKPETPHPTRYTGEGV